ncbi:uncharacterized protein N7529_003459, partial [Penicillium soppii]|uniref:uncharacterized protein n=1 Tax=Penicillium soppii TaxID=69789 RepID=UPI0025468B2F
RSNSGWTVIGGNDSSFNATIDQPTSPSLCDRPAKRQCRASQDPKDENKLQSHPQQSSDAATIEAEVSSSAHTRFPYGGIHEASPLQRRPGYTSPQTARPECYVVKSAEKIRLEKEQRQLQESNEWLASDSEILLQLCDKQALILWDQKRAA